MSTLKVNDIQTTGGAPNLGRVINVIQTIDSSATTVSGAAGFYSYGGLDTTVTPLRSSSKFLLMYNIRIGCYQYSRRAILYIDGSVYNSRATDNYRASTGSMFVPNTSNLSDASIWEHTGEYVYSHSGSGSFNVSFQVHKQDGNALYVNRASNYDDTDRGRPTSTLTIMEISQ